MTQNKIAVIGDGDLTSVQVYPSTLRLLRERRGLKKMEVAKKLGVAPSYVSRCETTQRRTVTMLHQEAANYASVLDVPVQTLRREFAIAQPEGVHFHTRKLTAEQRRKAVAHAGLVANHVNELMRLIDAPTRADIPQVDVHDLPPADAGRLAAQHVREAWGLGQEPITDLAGLLEGHGIFITDMRDVVDGVRGMTVLLDPNAAPVVFLAPHGNDDTHRQTLAHELGHLVMDHASGLLGDKEIEERATAFGGEFLAPWERVRDDVDGLVPSQMAKLTDLQREWGVHPAAFIQRGYLDDLFSPNQRRNWFVHLNARKVALDHTPSTYPVRAQAIRTLMGNVAALGWPEPDLSNTLGLRADELASTLDGWPFPTAA